MTMFHRSVGNLAPTNESSEERVKRLILAKFQELAALQAQWNELMKGDATNNENEAMEHNR